jgi:ubiquinone/menaquinone biosynthesis C-methylase UbiE
VDLATQRRDWEDFSRIDPLWAVLSDPSKRFGGWSHDEFFALGERDVAHFLEVCGRHGLPRGHSRALDFGCGAGRLTRALSSRFESCVGVDIAAPMIEAARDLNRDRPGCEFLVNDSDDLACFGDETFDFVVSHIVLQHVPGRSSILRYIGELARVLRPGGALVFQLPRSVPALYRLHVARRLYLALRRLGLSTETLYKRLHLQPMHMSALSIEVVSRRLEDRGARVIELVTEREPNGVVSVGYYATR